MKRKWLLILGTILIIAEATLILNMFYPVMSANQRKPKKTVPSRGSVKSTNVGVYSDQACTTPVVSIQWGLLEPGAAANQTVYMRNEGNSTITLVMALSNWNPSNASNYIDLNWDYTGQALNINQVIQVTFTMLISENIQGITDFSFDLTIATT